MTKKNQETGRSDFIESAENLIGANSSGGFIHKKPDVARVQKVIGYLQENTLYYDSEKMNEIIWVASQINLVRDSRKITSTLAVPDPMQNCTNFVVGLVKNGRFNASAIGTAVSSIPSGKENNDLHEKLSKTQTTYDLLKTTIPSQSPSPSPTPTSCRTFLSIIAEAITNLTGKIFDSSSEKKSAPSKTPSTTCQPKGFMQLAGDFLKRMSGILPH